METINPLNQEENSITHSRLIEAQVSLVWQVWTKPEYIKMWFGSNPNGIVLSANVDLVVGGQYSVSFQDPDGTQHTAFGEYLEIIENSKLHFTWEWESEAGHVSELIVEFSPLDEKALCTLTHFKLNPNSLHGYEEGWKSTIDKMVELIDKI